MKVLSPTEEKVDEKLINLFILQSAVIFIVVTEISLTEEVVLVVELLLSNVAEP